MASKIATWNTNGLAKYSQKIKIFIFSQHIDILFVSEIQSYCSIARY